MFSPSWPSLPCPQQIIEGDNSMKHVGIGLLASLLTLSTANAAGWGSVHKYVKPSGNCAGQEVLASHYCVRQTHRQRRTLRPERQHRRRAHLAARHHADRDQSAQWPFDHGADQRHRTVGHRLPHGRAARSGARRRATARHARLAIRLRGVTRSAVTTRGRPPGGLAVSVDGRRVLSRATTTRQ